MRPRAAALSCWRSVLEDARDPRNHVAGLVPLIEALVDHARAREFFPFTSMSSLCLSASSEYPWVCEGLPCVTLESSGTYALRRNAPRGSEESSEDVHYGLTLKEAVDAIDEVLRAYTVEPFVGSGVRRP